MVVAKQWIIVLDETIMLTNEILILIILLKGKVLLEKKWEIDINCINKNEVLLVLQKILNHNDLLEGTF